MVVFVTLFATDFIEVQQCEKRVNFCWIFVGGSLFSRDLIIADRSPLWAPGPVYFCFAFPSKLKF